jgi:hypothetical protein
MAVISTAQPKIPATVTISPCIKYPGVKHMIGPIIAIPMAAIAKRNMSTIATFLASLLIID